MATQLTNLSLPQLGLPTLDCKIADILATNLEIFASIFSSGQVHHVISSSFVRYLIKSVTNQSGWVASYYCIRRNIFNDYCRACCTNPFLLRRTIQGHLRRSRLKKILNVFQRIHLLVFRARAAHLPASPSPRNEGLLGQTPRGEQETGTVGKDDHQRAPSPGTSPLA